MALVGFVVALGVSWNSTIRAADRLKVGVAALPITPFGAHSDWDGGITTSGVWGEKFTDVNKNGRWDKGEPFEDDPANTAIDPSSKGKYDGVYLAGFGQNRLAIGKHDDLWARGLVLESGSTRLAIVSIDLIGYYSRANYYGQAEIEKLLDPGLGVQEILITSTHNHEAPDSIGPWGANPISDGKYPLYLRFVDRQIARAITLAAKSVLPARMKLGQTNPQLSPSIRGMQVRNGGRPPRFFDEELRVMQFAGVSGEMADKVIATVVNWNVHPESMEADNVILTSDFPHSVRESLEKRYGGKVIYITGDIGAVEIVRDSENERNERATFDGKKFPLRKQGKRLPFTFERTKAIGRDIARAAEEALARGEWSEVRDIELSKTDMRVPMDNGGYAFLFQQGVLDALPLSSPDKQIDVRTKIYAITMGDAQILTTPGELFPEVLSGVEKYKRRDCPQADTGRPSEVAVIEHMSGKYKFILGLCPDELGYIVPGYDFRPPTVDLSQLSIQQAEDACKAAGVPSHYHETNSASSQLAPVWACAAAALLDGRMADAIACSQQDSRQEESATDMPEQRKYKIERVGPANVVQLYADGFDQLTLKEKIFSYYIYQAALAGRDIAIDQHHPNALEVRDFMEEVYQFSSGIQPAVLEKIIAYLKLFWINNGFYDYLTSRKSVLECSFEELKQACTIAIQNGANFRGSNEPWKRTLEKLKPIIFDPDFESVLTNKSPGSDFISRSAVNFYSRGLTLKEVDEWTKAGQEKNSLNSRLVLENGKIVEQVWRAGGTMNPPGMYADDLKAVIRFLELAIPYASSETQAETVRKLVKYFKSGSLEDFRQFNIHWVKDNSNVDFIMGFIEVYLDPRGQKAQWESSIFYTDPQQTRLMQNLARLARYFEDRAPWREEYKKRIEQSPLANVINVTVGTGGTGPISPIGINLPNEQAIRQQYGSKSVLLHNIVEANEKSQGQVLVKEFAWDEQEIERQEKYGSRAGNLHTALHEVIGHGSGKVSDRLGGKDPSTFFPGYYNTLEETRADLVALWNAWDVKLVDTGWVQDRQEARLIGQTMFEQRVRAGLTQLRRIGKSDQLEQDHMKNRALIVNYLLRNSNAVRVEVREGKTYYRIFDFEGARKVVGELLAEIMRIKAEGDLAAAKALVDTYGLKVNVSLRDEVQERARKLDVASYMGLVMPKLEPVMDSQGKITDVKVSYPQDLAKQMLEYSRFTREEKKRTVELK